MLTKVLVLAGYFAGVLAVGLLAKSRIKDPPSEYFLAGRKFGPLVLLGTMAATNFSAFTVFGASGAGYRDGLAFFPIMGFGTGFMAIAFWLVGRKIWKIGKENSLVTPPELVRHIYGNRFLATIFALVMIIFTVPYIALQPWAGGMVLNQLFDIPQAWGAVIVTGIILLYTLRGGLKAVAWTDILQGILMLALLVTALAVVVGFHGGWDTATSAIALENPELYSRPGGAGTYLPGIWFGFMLLWFFCDPMFPQLFQRFYSAKSERSIGQMMMLYPIVCSVVFILPVLIGVFGHLSYPELGKEASDNIISLLAVQAGGDFLGTLVLAAGLAALMSTMDSQLLTLSSIFTHDLLPLVRKKSTHPWWMSRIAVVVLPVAGLILAINPPGTILDTAVRHVFTGLAVLFPSILFGLYVKNPNPLAAIVSIIGGEILVVLYAIPALNISSFGLLPAVPVIAVSVILWLLVSVFTGGIAFRSVRTGHWVYAGIFILIFLLAMDFWRWGSVGPLFLGLPLWAWWFAWLSVLQSVVMYYWVRFSLNGGNAKRVSQMQQ